MKYPCDECDYKAAQRTSLRIHKKGIHKGAMYQCNECFYKFTRKDNLKKHKKSVHEGSNVNELW